MKIRAGFVSNSSSSSFMIPLSALSAVQVQQIQNHIEVSREMKMGLYTGGPDEEFPGLPADWDIEVKTHALEGYTTMDNFDMGTFLKNIGVDEENVHWERNG